jgi:hypothetical protein
MSHHSDYHRYARMGAASGLTPNPFRKRNTLSASERTKALEARTLMSVLNTKPCCYKNRTYRIKNNNITCMRSYTDLLKYTRGFFMLHKNCDNVAEYVNTVSEGLYSYIDVRDLKAVNYVPCDYNPLYLLDPCRIVKGLIVPKAKIKPKHIDRMMQFPIPITKLSDCSSACPPCNNCTLPNDHDISDNICHHHYFPANSRIVYYAHRHDYESHPDPYPHPNYPATNQQSFFSYGKITRKQCCDQRLNPWAKHTKKYAQISGGSCNSYINRNFNKQAAWSGGTSCDCVSCCKKTHGKKWNAGTGLHTACSSCK